MLCGFDLLLAHTLHHGLEGVVLGQQLRHLLACRKVNAQDRRLWQSCYPGRSLPLGAEGRAVPPECGAQPRANSASLRKQGWRGAVLPRRCFGHAALPLSIFSCSWWASAMPSEMPPPPLPPPPPPRASRLAKLETIEDMDSACCLCTSARLRISSRNFLVCASCCASRELWCSSKIARSCASPTPADLASSFFATPSSRAHTSFVLLSSPHEPPPDRLDGIKTAPRLHRRRRGCTGGCPASLFLDVAPSEDTPTPAAFTLARRPVPTTEGRSPLNPIAAASPERTVRPPFASMSLEHRDDTAVVVRRRGADFSTIHGCRPTIVVQTKT